MPKYVARFWTGLALLALSIWVTNAETSLAFMPLLKTFAGCYLLMTIICGGLEAAVCLLKDSSNRIDQLTGCFNLLLAGAGLAAVGYGAYLHRNDLVAVSIPVIVGLIGYLFLLRDPFREEKLVG